MTGARCILADRVLRLVLALCIPSLCFLYRCVWLRGLRLFCWGGGSPRLRTRWLAFGWVPLRRWRLGLPWAGLGWIG